MILNSRTQQSQRWRLAVWSFPGPLNDCPSVGFMSRACSDTTSCLILQIFQANSDAAEVVLNKLHVPLLTRFIRIRPQTWHLGIALRLELFGCRVTGEVGRGGFR